MCISRFKRSLSCTDIHRVASFFQPFGYTSKHDGWVPYELIVKHLLDRISCYNYYGSRRGLARSMLAY